MARKSSDAERSDESAGAGQGTTLVSVRIRDELIAEIDALIAGLSTAWHQAKRSDALRHVIVEGLASLKRKRGPRRAKGSRR